MIVQVQEFSHKRQLAKEGRCPVCGEFSYPYYLCHKHRIIANVQRVLRKFEKNKWVDVEIDPIDKKKLFKWNGRAPKKFRKISPEAVAKMQLPRLNGKPMTQDLIQKCIIEVLEANQCPLTKSDIERGIKSMKTIGKIIPETNQLLSEYKLIMDKKSNLSKSQRDSVLFKINFLIKRGVIKDDLINTNQ